MILILTTFIAALFATAFLAKWQDKIGATLGCTGGSMVILIILIFVL